MSADRIADARDDAKAALAMWGGLANPPEVRGLYADRLANALRTLLNATAPGGSLTLSSAGARTEFPGLTFPAPVTRARCRRYHPVWLTHAQMVLLMALCAERLWTGQYHGNRKQYSDRLDAVMFALDAADGNCVDEMERPK